MIVEGNTESSRDTIQWALNPKMVWFCQGGKYPWCWEQMPSEGSWHNIPDHAHHLLFPYTELHFAWVTNPERQLLSPLSGGVGIN